MGTSFVDIGGRGFWMSDSVLELWLRLLALHIEDPVDRASPAAAVRDQWLLVSRGIFTGCVSPMLTEAISAPGGEQLVRATVQSLLGALEVGPPSLSKDALNLMGFSGVWTSNVETRKLVEVGEAWLALLDGRISTGPDDATFMPGSR